VEKLDKETLAAQMQVVNLAIGPWKFQVLSTLCNLGVFRLLEEGPLDAEEMARRLGVPGDALARLLACGAGLGYLTREDGVYCNAETTSRVLTPGKPGFMGNWLALCDRWYHTFGRLEEAVRTDRAPEDVNFGPDAAYNELFVKGMMDYTRYRGRDLASRFPLGDGKTLLDVGCGPALYSILLCREHPHLKCTAMDLPRALEIAGKEVAQAGMEDRIRLAPCDYKEASSLGEGYDVVFLSHILHQESEEECRRLLGKCFRSLNPGGILAVQAMFPDAGGTGTSYALLHDLLTLLIFPGGRNHTIADTVRWLEETGLVRVRHQPLSFFNVNSLVLGEKE